ncbi:MAG: 30S ribosomal protein S8e [Candidatus Pacearchaeota archaeon]
MDYGRKTTGGKYHRSKKKKKYELVRQPRIVKLKETKRKTIRTRGGNEKSVLLGANKVNVTDPKTHKTKVYSIKNVIETPSNRFLARQNVLTKGAIIETEDNRKVRITNRPSQEGSVQGILID